MLIAPGTPIGATGYQGRVVGARPDHIAPTFEYVRPGDVVAAIHEAGHVVAGATRGLTITEAQIGRVGGTGSAIRAGDVAWSKRGGLGKDGQRDVAVMTAAGAVAEGLAGLTPFSPSLDRRDADELADIAVLLGRGDDVAGWITEVADEARQILEANMDQLDAVATALLQRKRLDAGQIAAILTTRNAQGR